MASQLVGSFHTRNAALQAVEELAVLGFEVEMVPIEHEGSRAALFRRLLTRSARERHRRGAGSGDSILRAERIPAAGSWSFVARPVRFSILA